MEVSGMETKLSDRKKLSIFDLIRVPVDWRWVAIRDYSRFRKEAETEKPHAKNYLWKNIIEGLALKNRSIIDNAAAVVGGNLPEDAACRLTGAALCTLGFYDDGLQKLYKAVEINPIRRNLLTAASYLKSPDVAYQKLIFAKKAIDLDKDDTSSLQMAAKVLLSFQRVDEASEYVTRGLALDPRNSEFHYLMGGIYFNSGRYDLSLKEYTTARAFRKRDSKSWYGMAYCQLLLGDLKEANKSIKKAEKFSKKEGYYGYNKSLIEELKNEINGKHKLGIKLYLDDVRDSSVIVLLEMEAQKEEPKGEAFLFWKMLLSLQKWDFSILRDILNEVKGNLPEWFVLSICGRTKYELGIKEEGLADLEMAVAIKAERIPLLFYADALKKENENSKAKEQLKIMLLNDKTDDHALCGLGQVSDEINESMDYFNQVIEMHPDDWRIYFEKAKKLSIFKYFEEAISTYCLARARAENVNPAMLSLRIGKCLIELGRNNEAIQELERSLIEDASLLEAENSLSILRKNPPSSPIE